MPCQNEKRMNGHGTGNIVDRLRSAGLKVTSQRVAVYGALASYGHATVDSIVAKVRESLPVITVAAVYNILETMADSGLVGRVASTGKMVYDITPSYHDHLIVDGGSTVLDLDDPAFRSLVEEYLSRKRLPGYRIKGARVYVDAETEQRF